MAGMEQQQINGGLCVRVDEKKGSDFKEEKRGLGQFFFFFPMLSEVIFKRHSTKCRCILYEGTKKCMMYII